MKADGTFNSILVIYTYFSRPYFLQNNGPIRIKKLWSTLLPSAATYK